MRDPDADYTSARARRPYTPVGWIKLAALAIIVLLTIVGVIWMAESYITKERKNSLENKGMPGDMPGTQIMPAIPTPAPSNTPPTGP